MLLAVRPQRHAVHAARGKGVAKGIAEFAAADFLGQFVVFRQQEGNVENRYRGLKPPREGGGRDGRLERAKLDALRSSRAAGRAGPAGRSRRSRRHRCARQPVRRPWRYGRGATADRNSRWPILATNSCADTLDAKDMAIREAPTARPQLRKNLVHCSTSVAGPKSPKAGSKRNDMFLSTEFLKK